MKALTGYPFGQLVQAVQPEETVANAKLEIARMERFVELPLSSGVQFVEVDAAAEGASGSEMINDRQWDEHGPRPIAHVPEIHVKPFADQQHFAGDCGH